MSTFEHPFQLQKMPSIEVGPTAQPDLDV